MTKLPDILCTLQLKQRFRNEAYSFVPVPCRLPRLHQWVFSELHGLLPVCGKSVTRWQNVLGHSAMLTVWERLLFCYIITKPQHRFKMIPESKECVWCNPMELPLSHQVIYKRFNIACPLQAFGNYSVTEAVPEDACTAKLFTVNQEVGNKLPHFRIHTLYSYLFSLKLHFVA